MDADLVGDRDASLPDSLERASNGVVILDLEEEVVQALSLFDPEARARDRVMPRIRAIKTHPYPDSCHDHQVVVVRDLETEDVDVESFEFAEVVRLESEMP